MSDTTETGDMRDERDETAGQSERERQRALVREREMDALMELAGAAAFDALDPADPRNDRFFMWVARQLRTRRTPEERRDDEERAREFGKRMAIRWAQRSLDIHDVDSAPPLEPTPVSATVAASLEHVLPNTQAPHVDMAIAAGAGRELWDEECTECVVVPPEVRPGLHLAVRVAGDSMMPYLHAGDTVLVRLGEKPAAGTVIVARLPDDGYVLKRVGRLDRYRIELLSLNPAYPPLSVPREERTVLGRVVLRWCPHGTVATALPG